MSANDKPARKIWLPYLFDIVAPLAAYLVVHAFGVKAVWALSLGGLVAGSSTVVNTIRRRGLDAVGALVVVEIAASIALQLWVHDARLMLIRPSFYTAIAAVYLMFTAVAGRPLSYAGARPMAAKGGPERLAAYERAWERSAEFRRTHRVVSLGFGLALLVDSVLRVLVVYKLPLDRAAWLSNVPHVTAMLLLITVSALAGRKFKRLVDEEQGAGNARREIRPAPHHRRV